MTEALKKGTDRRTTRYASGIVEALDRGSIIFDLDTLVIAADAIVIGTHVESRSVWEDGKIWTYTRVRVERPIHGSLQRDVTPWVRTRGGVIGAVSHFVDGEAVRSCTLPVSRATGAKVTTVEGLGAPEKPHPLQAAFIAEQAAQCGYCVAGMVMTGAALLAKKPNATLDEAKEALAGNLCRCGTHQRILRAMMRASGRSLT